MKKILLLVIVITLASCGTFRPATYRYQTSDSGQYYSNYFGNLANNGIADVTIADTQPLQTSININIIDNTPRWRFNYAGNWGWNFGWNNNWYWNDPYWGSPFWGNSYWGGPYWNNYVYTPRVFIPRRNRVFRQTPNRNRRPVRTTRTYTSPRRYAAPVTRSYRSNNTRGTKTYNTRSQRRYTRPTTTTRSSSSRTYRGQRSTRVQGRPSHHNRSRVNNFSRSSKSRRN